ncbi:MAG: IS5 family transposase [bacterium]
MVKTKQNRWESTYEDKRIWKIYQHELVLQGEFFFDLSFLESWDEELKEMNNNKRGSPYQYPNSLFYWLSPLYSFLSSRKLEGSMDKLSEYIPRLKSCDHSTIIARLNQLDLVIDFDRNKSYYAAVDSTGNKLTNRGEYISKKWRIQRDWVKVSIVIDKFTKELLDVEVALDKEATDSELAKKHLANLQNLKIIDFTADGAYYETELYEMLNKQNIQPVIKMPSNGSNKGLDPMHSAVREMETLGGYFPWRDKYKYGHRWNIEGYNSSTKRCFGEICRMHKKENCFKEAKNKFINNERMVKYAKRRIVA